MYLCFGDSEMLAARLLQIFVMSVIERRHCPFGTMNHIVILCLWSGHCWTEDNLVFSGHQLMGRTVPVPGKAESIHVVRRVAWMEHEEAVKGSGCSI
jgi:hypothetical protein